MQSLGLLQTYQNEKYSTTNNSSDFSWLASQYMDMFDIAKVDTTLLMKRERQALDNFYQGELLKKVKTSAGIHDRKSGSTSLTQDPASFQSYIQTLKDSNFFFNAKPMREIPLLQQLNSSHNKSHSNQTKDDSRTTSLQKITVKEEYVKQEEQNTSQGSRLENFKPLFPVNHTHATATNSDQSSPQGDDVSISGQEDPALFMYTKEFRDWDLATIFNFLKSGKPRESFEKEKQYKIEKKLRKKRNASKKDEKLGCLKQKPLKFKKIADYGEEYKPSRALLTTKPQDRISKTGMRLRKDKCKTEEV